MLEQLLNFFVSNAYAEVAETASGPQNGGLSFALMFVIFLLFIYFSVWRPQSKRSKEQQQLLSSLAKGDEVMTAGGLIGKVAKMSDHYIGLAVANNVEIFIQKSSVVTILPKGTIKSIE